MFSSKKRLHYVISIYFIVFQIFNFEKTLAENSDGRVVIPFNHGWKFHYANEVSATANFADITLPHTWNAKEVLEGKSSYNRTCGIYQKLFSIQKGTKGRRAFLHFEGANSVADVFVNNKFVGEHHGGYTAFTFEITPFIKDDGFNSVTVQVSNAYRLDVLPLAGDFNVYGGLHRPVSLILTEANCISPLDYGSSGIYVRQDQVSAQSANITIVSKLSLKNIVPGLKLISRIYDADNKTICQMTTQVSSDLVEQNVVMDKPFLWNGRQNPYCYRVRVLLVDDKRVIDSVDENFGLRYFHVDPDKGFYLNGKHLDLRGVCKHQDFAGVGSAYEEKHYRKDLELLLDIGANAVRLTHYPQGHNMYDLCDSNGIIVWTEIPLVGPGGYSGAGYVENAQLQEQVRQVMTELIRQNFNHPSIFFWGLFNELKLDYDNPVPFVSELNLLAKREDPSRLTNLSTFLDGPVFNQLSDVISWNKYFGWYAGQPAELGKWADKIHAQYPSKAIAIGEYGAGGSVKQHQEILQRPSPGSRFHPEEWQTIFHEQSWAELSKRPFIWGKFIWVLCDLASSIREEGDTVGMNDKGLVTYDRTIKKDAYYFYKANWNITPMIYITDRRDSLRTSGSADIKVYCNLPEAELFVNGKSVGKNHPDELNRFFWKNISLKEGKNIIIAKAGSAGQITQDTVQWYHQ